MQRFSFWLLLLAALYVSADACATPDQPDTAKPVSAVQAGGVTFTPTVSPLPALLADNPAPHIALLLPLKSVAFARAATAVKQGFIAAASVQQGLPVRVYASSDETKEIVTLYRQALVNGAIAVAGPLTRDGVAKLAAYPGITVPTLALNTAELPGNGSKLYFFGLPAENEARYAAQIAASANLHHATIISTGTTISKRLAAAFADEWKHLGGNVTADVPFTGDFDALTDLPVAAGPGQAEQMLSATGVMILPTRPAPPSIAPGNMVFLATDHDKARLIRPYLNPNLPIYATSQLFQGNTYKLANFDLNDIHFVDMPWLLQPDHPAVMVYPHADTQLEPEMERLYALGIDAYRLVYILLTNRADTSLPLDGVTGRLRLGGQQFQREPIPAFFKQGMGLTAETLEALNAAKAAAKASAVSAATTISPK